MHVGHQKGIALGNGEAIEMARLKDLLDGTQRPNVSA
jgi:hypothetical protein